MLKKLISDMSLVNSNHKYLRNSFHNRKLGKNKTYVLLQPKNSKTFKTKYQKNKAQGQENIKDHDTLQSYKLELFSY